MCVLIKKPAQGGARGTRRKGESNSNRTERISGVFRHSFLSASSVVLLKVG